MSLSSDFQKLSVSGVITLYELDARHLGADLLRWHGHVSHEDWQYIYEQINSANYASAADYVEPVGTEDIIRRDIIWQNEVYTPIPIHSDGLEVRGDGRASTPTLSLANNLNGVQGAISALCLHFEDFAGAKLTVYTTLAKYLDAANFTDGNANAANEYKKQVWYIEQKTSEDASAVSFELSNPVDFEGQRIPCREITSFCHWCVRGRYRGQECAYTGIARFKEDGTPTDDPAKDVCGGRLTDCKLRNNEARFGGFPAANLNL